MHVRAQTTGTAFFCAIKNIFERNKKLLQAVPVPVPVLVQVPVPVQATGSTGSTGVLAENRLIIYIIHMYCNVHVIPYLHGTRIQYFLTISVWPEYIDLSDPKRAAVLVWPNTAQP